MFSRFVAERKESLIATTRGTQPKLRQISQWIGGRAIAGRTGRSGPVYDPATGRIARTVGFASVAEVDAAVAAALSILARGREPQVCLGNPASAQRITLSFERACG
jgi:hypothetical protein